jgi:hypothetical protein
MRSVGSSLQSKSLKERIIWLSGELYVLVYLGLRHQFLLSHFKEDGNTSPSLISEALQSIRLSDDNVPSQDDEQVIMSVAVSVYTGE